MASEAEVLEKVGSYCTEKQYTLDDSFRSQFSNKFAAANPDADINDENILKSIKFNLDSAFSATSKGIEAQKKGWDEEKAKLTSEIEKLKKAPTKKEEKKGEEQFELPEDIKQRLSKLEAIEERTYRQEKRAEVLELAKKGVREDLQGNLEDLLDMTSLDYTKESKDLAKQLNENFAKLYKNNIGDIKPSSPERKTRRVEDILNSVPVYTIK